MTLTLSRAPADSATTDPFNPTTRQRTLARTLTIVLILLALVAGIATYVALTGSSIFGNDRGVITGLLITDVVLVIALAGMVVARFLSLWWARRSGLAGARLHIRIVTMFGLMAAVPTVFLGVASALFFHLGIQAWFSERVQSAVRDSASIAQAYVEEHRKNIEADILAMAFDISRQASLLESYSTRFDQVLDAQINVRGLSEATVLSSTGQVLARSALSFGMDFTNLPQDALRRANRGEVVILTTADDRVRALVRLDGFLDAYLFVGRFVDPRVINYVERTQAAVDEYNTLENKRSGIQITFAVIYVVVSLLVLFAAVLGGLWVATRLVEPIARLIGVTERVRAGDLTSRVEVDGRDDELATLGRAFNRMTGQLQAQHGALLDANRQMDERRRFIEAMLSGVSSGVLGVDQNGRVVLSNRAAEEFFGLDDSALIGRTIGEIAPEMQPLCAKLQQRQDDYVQGQIHMTVGDRPRHVMLRLVGGLTGQADTTYVVTFDDVSDLVAAQRTAAWADVARRIAHEIKNPLTPIQLSAERLKRKYLKEIKSDPEIFNQCTDTIVRQVGDIGRMVDEFSAFARMPAASFEIQDVVEEVKQAVFLRQVGTPEIAYDSRLPAQPVFAALDRRQINQALTNILKNAAESIEARAEAVSAEGGDYHGRIITSVEVEGRMVRIVVIDNGRGLPTEGRDRLTEPYVTTRVKGTGLGLAIVRKIMEEHGGAIQLRDAPQEDGGAMVILSFPLKNEMPVKNDINMKAGETQKVVHGA